MMTHLSFIAQALETLALQTSSQLIRLCTYNTALSLIPLLTITTAAVVVETEVIGIITKLIKKISWDEILINTPSNYFIFRRIKYGSVGKCKRNWSD
jgi:hypothetical protein